MDWIKLWTKEVIFGTTSKELPYDMRGIWFQLLAMAGLEPCYGQVCIAEGLPYSPEQLASLLDVPNEILEKALKILQEVEKVKINGAGIIEIINWGRYQSHAGYMQTWRERQEKEPVRENVIEDVNPPECDRQMKMKKNSKIQKEEKDPDPSTRISRDIKVPTPKGVSKGEKTNPQIKEFIDHAFQVMKEKTGTALVINSTSEPALVKRLLGTIKLDRLKLLWGYFIEKEFEDDDWLDKMGKTITTFNTRINNLNQNYNGWRQSQDFKAKYGRELK